MTRLDILPLRRSQQPHPWEDAIWLREVKVEFDLGGNIPRVFSWGWLVLRDKGYGLCSLVSCLFHHAPLSACWAPYQRFKRSIWVWFDHEWWHLTSQIASIHVEDLFQGNFSVRNFENFDSVPNFVEKHLAWTKLSLQAIKWYKLKLARDLVNSILSRILIRFRVICIIYELRHGRMQGDVLLTIDLGLQGCIFKPSNFEHV